MKAEHTTTALPEVQAASCETPTKLKHLKCLCAWTPARASVAKLISAESVCNHCYEMHALDMLIVAQQVLARLLDELAQAGCIGSGSA